MMDVAHLMSEDGFEKITAADKLRALLFWLNADTAIPENCKELRKAFPEQRNGLLTTDGPKAVTELRNYLVHPTKKNRDRAEEIGFPPVQDAWRLNLWYIELALLRLINYKGLYEHRLGDPLVAVPGSTRIASTLPWCPNQAA